MVNARRSHHPSSLSLYLFRTIIVSARRWGPIVATINELPYQGGQVVGRIRLIVLIARSCGGYEAFFGVVECFDVAVQRRQNRVGVSVKIGGAVRRSRRQRRVSGVYGRVQIRFRGIAEKSPEDVAAVGAAVDLLHDAQPIKGAQLRINSIAGLVVSMCAQQLADVTCRRRQRPLSAQRGKYLIAQRDGPRGRPTQQLASERRCVRSLADSASPV